MGSKSTPVTSNTQTMTAPSGFGAPYAQFGAQEAARLYGKGDTAPIVGQAQGYLDKLLYSNPGDEAWNRMSTGFDLNPSNNATLNDTAQGKFLNSNPYLDQMYQSASRPVIDQVQSQFSKAGRYGSAANQDVLGRTLSELSGNIYGQNYARERQNQLSAGNALTTLAQSGARLFGDTVNSGRASQLQGMLFAPSLAAEQSGWGNLQRYLAAISGAGLGSSSSGSQTQPSYSNPYGEAAGALGTGALASSLLFGKNGVFPGAASNGLRSAGDYLGGLFSSGAAPALSSESLGEGLGYFAGY